MTVTEKLKLIEEMKRKNDERLIEAGLKKGA